MKPICTPHGIILRSTEIYNYFFKFMDNSLNERSLIICFEIQVSSISVEKPE